MTDSRKTPLYDLHIALGAKMVDFAGWSMPVNYPAGLMAEHAQCREKAALFDVSHMGQVELRGSDVAAKFETLVPAAVTTLGEGKARYTFFTNADGGILDDLIVTNAGDHLFVVVNASMRDQDLAILRGLDIEVRELDRALIAIQGPAADEVLAQHVPIVTNLTFMQSMEAELLGADVRISRLGYTGEDGFEISLPTNRAVEITEALLQHDDLEPAGLGARDSLRLEAGLCLYGNDIDPTTSPIEAQLGWAIQKRRREEGGFPGADRILRELADGPTRKLVGIRPDGRAPARRDVEIAKDGAIIGTITSGGFGPTVEGPVSMGYVRADLATPGTTLDLMIRGKAQPATVIDLPFVPHNYKR